MAAAQRADLTVSKAICPATVTESGQLTYTFVLQNFGNTAHTGTTNADKMYVPNATHFGHDGTQFCQLLCIHSLRH